MTHNQSIANTRKNLLIFAQRHGVSQACKAFGVSRTNFYKIKEQFIKTGSLEPRVRRKPRMPNETAISKKKMLVSMVREHPGRGIDYYSFEFRKRGISFHRGSIWACLKRLGLNKKFNRLLYIETLAGEGKPVTERTLKALKRRMHKIRRGAYPGQIVALDTFYVGNLKGVGRVYQLTGLDLYSRYGWARLSTDKDQYASIKLVEESLIPKFYNNGVEIESIQTDNGSEFIGTKFRQMLADYDIKHYFIARGKPLLNGYCERFQRTIYEEFYQRVFRTQFFKSLEELQNSLNEYLVKYNFERPHFGLKPEGAIPIEIFKSTNKVLRQRFQNLLT